MFADSKLQGITSDMKKVLEFAVGALLTFFPPRYRRGRALRFEAMAASVFQAILASSFLTYRFMIFAWQRAGIIGAPLDTPSNLPDVNAIRGGGVFMMAEFIMQPLNILLLYFIYEAVVRCGGAFVSHQILGTLPLYGVGWIHNLIDRQLHKRYMGELVQDEIVRSSGGMIVRSCRPKLHWNPYMTVEYQGDFFQMIREEPGQSSRRFTYHLRRNPVGRIVVTIDHYDPSDVFKPAERESTLQQMSVDLARKMKRKSPLVEDLIVRGTGRQDFSLKVYTCRPKSDWNSYVAIEFEDQFFELFKQEQIEGPRNFLYFLRKAPPNKPAPVVRHYKIDDVLKEA